MRLWKNFCFDSEKDKDILRVIEREVAKRNLSRHIREAICFYERYRDIGDLAETIRELGAEVRRLRISGIAVMPNEDKAGEVYDPDLEEAKRNLAGLGGRLEAGEFD